MVLLQFFICPTAPRALPHFSPIRGHCSPSTVFSNTSAQQNNSTTEQLHKCITLHPVCAIPLPFKRCTFVKTWGLKTLQEFDNLSHIKWSCNGNSSVTGLLPASLWYIFLWKRAAWNFSNGHHNMSTWAGSWHRPGMWALESAMVWNPLVMIAIIIIIIIHYILWETFDVNKVILNWKSGPIWSPSYMFVIRSPAKVVIFDRPSL